MNSDSGNKICFATVNDWMHCQETVLWCCIKTAASSQISLAAATLAVASSSSSSGFLRMVCSSWSLVLTELMT